MKILITGGAGYIGSHTVVELLNESHNVVIADNYINSSPKVLTRIEQITKKKPICVEIDITDEANLLSLFRAHSFDAVIHFAALKAVGESIQQPLTYYKNNVVGLLNVLQCMKQFHVPKIIFSSSATVYGQPKSVPIKETAPVGIGITNPYGQTKVMCEQILTDSAYADPDLQVILLRYFNPIGAHESGLIGEDPSEVPNNILPFISQVAVGKLKELKVFGSDYSTKDGTGVRDYIHVVDLAKGHLVALAHTPAKHAPAVFNLGTGTGYSVLELIKSFEAASGKKIPYEFVGRRPGDIAECYADASKAKEVLNWSAQKSLSQMCEDAWRWQSQNPDGYAGQ